MFDVVEIYKQYFNGDVTLHEEHSSVIKNHFRRDIKHLEIDLDATLVTSYVLIIIWLPHQKVMEI